MKDLTLKNIINACGGEGIVSPSDLEKEISAVTTDSRAVTPGCLFAAIRGEHTDGHKYVASALENGALCAVVETVPDGVTGNLIKVENTVTALQAIARFYRERFSIPVVGISGSVGKTTAKEMVCAVLSRRFHVHKTAGNFNNDLGVPLTVFGLREEHGAAVIELGVSHFGDMERIASVAEPTCALFTVIGDAHLEFLGSREGVLAEKGVMEDHLPPDGAVFYNGDDPLLAARQWKHRSVSFGMGEGCTVRAENVRLLPSGGTGLTVISGERRFDVEVPAFGRHMVYAALEGAALGLKFGLTDAEIAAGVASYETVGKRARLVSTAWGTLIDDCYNANPTSLRSAIESLADFPGRKVCILGDMLELGESSPELHRAAGAFARESGAGLVLTLGERARETAAGAGDIARHFGSREELIAALPCLIKEGDAVLVKASHSMRFEEISEALEKLKL